MRPLDEVFAALATSAFRRRFRLQSREQAYLPARGHPVFVAQHATATCCRGCLEKWHGIPRVRVLIQREQEHVHTALERWLRAQEAEKG